MKVLFATDGSACSAHAIERAQALLALRNAEIYVVAVADTAPVMVGYEGPGAGAGVLMNRIHSESTAQLNHAVEVFQAAGLTATPLDREGDPVRKIIEAAEEVNADLVVLGSHGRGPLGRLVKGSVSDAVLHRCHCNVMIIRPEA